MRLRCLNLIRYGHFTDFSLDFGERAQNGSDFHIIFGENEAGKSTAIHGFFEFLFGINNKTEYGFQHGYDNLRVGATLEFDNKTVELSRIKGRRDTLRSAEDKPVSEDTLTSALYGLSDASYQKMFCLNEETLEKGGEEILASKGDVGRLLFTGTAGLSDLSKVLEGLQGQANQVYKEGRSPSEISALKQQLEELDDKRKKLDTQVTTYKQLANALQRSEEAYKQASKKRDDIRIDQFNFKSLKNAFPIRTTLLKFEKELEDVSDLPDLPVGWVEEVIRLQQTRDTIQKEREEVQSNINSANRQLAALKIDPIINMRENINAVETLKGRFEAAQEELPQLCADLRDINTNLDEIKQKLGVDKSSKLEEFVIPEDAIIRLEKLLEDEKSLKQSLETAKQELFRAIDELQQAQRQKDSFPAPDEKVFELDAIFNSYNDKKEDPQQRVNNARKTLSQKSFSIDEELKSLAPWRGTKHEIKTLETPTTAQADNWSKKATKLREKLDDRKREQQRHKRELASLEATMNSQSEYTSEISDASAKNSRGEREKAWAEHRKRLDATSADEFENALANDDNIRDKRLAAVDQLSRLRAAEEQLTIIQGLLKVNDGEIRGIEEDLAALRNEMRPVLSNAKLPDDFEAESLQKWLEDLHRVRKLVEGEDECRSELYQAVEECDQQRTVLLQALKKTGAEQSETIGLGELRAITKAYLNRANEKQRQHDDAVKTFSMAENEKQLRSNADENVVTRLKDWEIKWKQALEKDWLKQKTIDEVQALLGLFKNLATKLANQKKLSRKISEKESEINKFYTSVTNLVCSLGLKEENDKKAQFSDLQGKLNKAQEIEKESISADKDRKHAVKQLEKANGILSNIEKRVQEMATYFFIPEGEATLDCLASTLKQAQKKNKIVNSICEKESALCEHLGVKNRIDADEKFTGITFDEIEKRLIGIEGELKEVDQNFENRCGEWQVARREIEKIGGDAGVAMLNEERQGILLEISKKANHALALHLGLMAAEHALTKYRDHHRSELLMQTADAFKIITDGAFPSLTTQPGQASDRLIAIRSNERSIAAEKMSKGTRYQLYLALRLAAYRLFCNKTGSLPFIGDDIMETFDDRRSESAMRQLNEIAKHGQVLYFTHHRHLCDIAKKVCGNGVMIHEIPKRC